MAKDKKNDVAMVSDDDTTEAVPLFALPIAQPMAPEKLSKKLHKTIRKAAKQKSIRRGVREIVKSMRKLPPATRSQSLVILAANIAPMDVIAHLPVLCEDNQVPYVWVKSKEELGEACLTKRATSCVMIVPGGGGKKGKEGKEKASKEDKEVGEGLEECRKGVNKLDAMPSLA